MLLAKRVVVALGILLLLVLPFRNSAAHITVFPGTTYQTWRYNMMLLAATPAWGATEPSSHPAWDAGLKARLLDQLVNQLGINTVQLTEPSGDIENNRDCWTQSNLLTHNLREWYGCRYAPVSAGPDPALFYCADSELVNCPQSWPMASLDYQYEKYILGSDGMAALLRARRENLHVVFQYIHWPASPTYLDQTPELVGRQVLAAFLHIRNKYGAENVPGVVDIMVEPDGECVTEGSQALSRRDCGKAGVWSYENLGRAAASIANRLRAAGFPICSPGQGTEGCIQIWGPSTALSTRAVDWYSGLKAVAGGAIFSALTTHWYDGRADSWAEIDRAAASDGVCPVMTELVPLGAADMYNLAALHGVCGVEKYGSASIGASDAPTSYLTITSAAPYVSHYAGPDRTIHSPAWFLPQYMLYMRDGDVRERAESDNSSFAPLAFRSPSGRDKVIVKTTAIGKAFVGVSGVGAGTYGCTYTLNNETLLRPCGADQAIGPGGTLTTALSRIPTPAEGSTTAVITFFRR